MKNDHLTYLANWRIFEEGASNAPKPDGPQGDSAWSERQALLYHFFEGIAASFGPFDQSTGPDGAAYVRGLNNEFAAEGLTCENCAFYMSDGGEAWHCSIVDGNIDPDGVCRFVIVPEGATGTAASQQEKKAASEGARKKKPKKMKWDY